MVIKINPRMRKVVIRDSQERDAVAMSHPQNYPSHVITCNYWFFSWGNDSAAQYRWRAVCVVTNPGAGLSLRETHQSGLGSRGPVDSV